MKNVILLFLSDYKIDKESRLVRNDEKKYIICNGTVPAVERIQTNEAPMADLLATIAQKGEKPDSVFYIATDMVSSADDNKGLYVLENEKKEHYSHVKYFINRMTKFHPELSEEQFISVDYNENYCDDKESEVDGDLTEYSLKKTFDLKQKIEERVGKFSDCRLYVDITGGMRPVNMIMTALVQLLQYDGAAVEKVVFSDFKSDKPVAKVYQVNEISNLYKLVSGADEFSNYGSSRAIEKYFGWNEQSGENIVSPELHRLLKAMHGFSDALKLCRPDKTEAYINDLFGAIGAFEAAEKSTKELFFMKLLETIKKRLENLEKAENRRLEIIRWCVENDLLQQAMTFCTEWLPPIIVAAKLCCPAEDIAGRVEKQAKESHANKDVHFLTTYFEKEETVNSARFYEIAKSDIVEFVKRLKKLSGGSSQVGEYEVAIEKYKGTPFEASGQLLKEAFERLFAEFETAKPENWEPSADSADVVERLLYCVWAKSNENREGQGKEGQTYYDFLKSKQEKAKGNKYGLCLTIGKLLQNVVPDKLGQVFEVNRLKGAGVENADKLKGWAQRETQYTIMKNAGMIKFGLPEAEAMELLKGYFDLKGRRNDVNHANQKDITVEMVKKQILDYLALLQSRLVAI